MIMCVLVMVAMSMVHEQMHQRAGEQQQKRQRTEQVGAVFGEQKECGNRQKSNKNPVVSPWSTTRIVPGRFVMLHHALQHSLSTEHSPLYMLACEYSNSASMACATSGRRIRT